MAKALEGRGWSVWWDRKISAGASFDKKIEQELESATCIVVLWSGSSIDSEWVRNEAAVAVERDALIPTMIEELRLPIGFRRRQTINLSGWDRTATDPALSTLLDAVSERLDDSPKRANVYVVAPAHRSRPFWEPSWKAWSPAGAGVIAVSAAFLWPDKSTGYTLVCKGGGPFGIQTDGPFSVNIVFVPAQGPAAEAMAPGQCAWTDRALNADEPHKMCYSGLSASSLSRRFVADELVRQEARFDPAGRCLRVTSLF